MEPSRFDDLTKALATATSRRQALKTIAATTIGGILGLGHLGPAFAKPKCHRAGLGCDTDNNCCTSQCLTCQNGKCVSTCTSGQVCLSNGTCATPCDRSNSFSCACGTCSTHAGGGAYCGLGGPPGITTPCNTDKDCPSGQFCQAFVTENLCSIAC